MASYPIYNSEGRENSSIVGSVQYYAPAANYVIPTPGQPGPKGDQGCQVPTGYPGPAGPKGDPAPVYRPIFPCYGIGGYYI